jgi:hypothetical protein
MSPVAVIMALVIRGGVAIKDHPIWTKHSKSCSKVSPAFLVGGRRGGGGPAKGGASNALVGVVLGGVLAVWGLMGFYQLDEQERAVVLRFGEYHATLTPGLQWNPPLIDEVITVNTTKGARSGFT